MPVLTALTSQSLSTDSSCAWMNSSGMGKMSSTPCVFWAVTAVITDVAWTPTTAMALTSACTPAPPMESDPATVRADLIVSPNGDSLYNWWYGKGRIRGGGCEKWSESVTAHLRYLLRPHQTIWVSDIVVTVDPVPS